MTQSRELLLSPRRARRTAARSSHGEVLLQAVCSAEDLLELDEHGLPILRFEDQPAAVAPAACRLWLYMHPARLRVPWQERGSDTP
jgi:hypothetical protein